MKTLDCTKLSDMEIKNKTEELLDNLVLGKINGIRLTNIVSDRFCELFEIVDAPEDTNGWQLDWWGYMSYKGVKLNLFGCAWYGTIGIDMG